ncbi:transmembrane protein [Anaeramoeba flamelloides]|uniref:Transmembrane protein n=1 Tax=Anaeramoeba flamelloides TaxID=1746091 RepID=A0ABQ8XJE2_9EUKA|nr:transmembrane protein [Anaeramoeba flamelloides]
MGFNNNLSNCILIVLIFFLLNSALSGAEQTDKLNVSEEELEEFQKIILEPIQPITIRVRVNLIFVGFSKQEPNFLQVSESMLQKLLSEIKITFQHQFSTGDSLVNSNISYAIDLVYYELGKGPNKIIKQAMNLLSREENVNPFDHSKKFRFIDSDKFSLFLDQLIDNFPEKGYTIFVFNPGNVFEKGTDYGYRSGLSKSELDNYNFTYQRTDAKNDDNNDRNKENNDNAEVCDLKYPKFKFEEPQDFSDVNFVRDSKIGSFQWKNISKNLKTWLKKENFVQQYEYEIRKDLKPNECKCPRLFSIYRCSKSIQAQLNYYETSNAPKKYQKYYKKLKKIKILENLNSNIGNDISFDSNDNKNTNKNKNKNRNVIKTNYYQENCNSDLIFSKSRFILIDLKAIHSTIGMNRELREIQKLNKIPDFIENNLFDQNIVGSTKSLIHSLFASAHCLESLNLKHILKNYQNVQKTTNTNENENKNININENENENINKNENENENKNENKNENENENEITKEFEKIKDEWEQNCNSKFFDIASATSETLKLCSQINNKAGKFLSKIINNFNSAEVLKENEFDSEGINQLRMTLSSQIVSAVERGIEELILPISLKNEKTNSIIGKFFDEVTFYTFVIVGNKKLDPTDEYNFDIEEYENNLLQFKLPNQDFHFIVNELSLTDDRIIASAIYKSLKTSIVETFDNYGNKIQEERIYIDSVIIQDTLQHSMNALIPKKKIKNSYNKKKKKDTFKDGQKEKVSSKRDIITFVISLDFDKPVYIDKYYQSKLLSDFILVVHSNFQKSNTSDSFCNGNPIKTNFKSPTRFALQNTITYLTGILPNYQSTEFQIGDGFSLNSFITPIQFSQMRRDSAFRNYFIYSIHDSMIDVNTAIQKITQIKYKEFNVSITNYKNLIMHDFFDHMSALKIIYNYGAKSIEQGHFERATHLIPLYEYHSKKISKIAKKFEKKFEELKCQKPKENVIKQIQNIKKYSYHNKISFLILILLLLSSVVLIILIKLTNQKRIYIQIN